MSNYLRALVAAVALVLGPATAQAARPHPTREQIAMTMRVHVCEENGLGWNVGSKTSEYAGGLGWLQATWRQYRLPWMPAFAFEATLDDQVLAMANFARVNGWPDQDGCWKGGY